MMHRHVGDPRWIAGLLQCCHCRSRWVAVFPDNINSVECVSCGNMTVIRYARLRKRKRR